jgi:hypothetical protein
VRLIHNAFFLHTQQQNTYYIFSKCRSRTQTQAEEKETYLEIEQLPMKNDSDTMWASVPPDETASVTPQASAATNTQWP